jgi:hypothetical protein
MCGTMGSHRRREMNRLASLSNAAKLNVTGLVLTAIGILLERGAGSELYPTLAPPIVLLVGAAVVAFRPGRLTSYLGLIIPLILAAGLAISVLLSRAFLEQLVNLGNAGIVLGSVLHVVGLIAAVAGGVGMVLRIVGSPSDPGGSR